MNKPLVVCLFRQSIRFIESLKHNNFLNRADLLLNKKECPMKALNWIMLGVFTLTFSLGMVGSVAAKDKTSVKSTAVVKKQAVKTTVSINDVVTVQKYNRSIHVMAMLLIGFGFLMVFVRGYGLSAITATFMMTAVGIPLYLMLKSFGIFGHAVEGIDALILGEFAVASLLICAGAVLGRLKIWQYMLLAILFMPIYMANEWIVLDKAFGLVKSFSDTGGSIVIHAFGAIFGLGIAFSMTTKKERKIDIESDFTSDRFSLLGSMVLWVFWPSFCAALVAPAMIPQTVMNVIIALCGSTIAAYIATVTLRKHIDAADIANATLAGGVAIGSTCDIASMPVAMGIGVLAGFASTFGFAVIQSRLQKGAKLVDTCGVSNLHGIPGLLGGLAAVFVVSGINAGAQLIGIGITVGIALISGLVVGKILSFTGRKSRPYEDVEEFEAA
jgi:ammonium transporter Rh